MAETEKKPISTAEAVRANLAIKMLKRVVDKYEDDQMTRCYKAFHECLRRKGEEDFPDVVALGGNT